MRLIAVQMVPLTLFLTNLLTLRVTNFKGIDFAANYSFDSADMFGMDIGNVALGYNGTYTMKNEFEAFAGDTLFDCAGLFGNNCGEPDPTYRHFVTADVSKGALNANVTWQLIGGVTDGNIIDGSKLLSQLTSLVQNTISIHH